MSNRGILVVACMTFFALGWLAGGIGPAVNDLAERNHTDLGGIGAIFMLTFLGGLPAQGAVGLFSDRYGQRPVLLAGIAVLGLGAFGVALGTQLWITLAFSVVWGLGFGTLDVGNNILIAEVYPGRVNVMNLLHVFFGVGAVISPAVAGLSLELVDSALPVLVIGGILMLSAFPLMYRIPRGRVRNEEPTTDHAIVANGRFSYRMPLLWVFGVVMLIYVGVEIGIGGWSPAYLERTTSLSESSAALSTSVFWLALSGSRLLMAVIGSRYTALQVLWACMIGSAAGSLLLAVSTGGVALSVAGIVVAGFAFGPVYPTLMMLVSRTFRSGPGKAASVVAALGGIGGGVLPWLQGVLLDRVSPAVSVIFVGAGAVIMLALWAVAQRYIATHAAPDSPRERRVPA